jgi:hypothetical protein
MREGAKHTIWHNPALDVRTPVPRHREIPIGTARAICRQLSIPPPLARPDTQERRQARARVFSVSLDE